jgi:hypothetical protein
MSDLDNISFNISSTLKSKFPDIDNNHYSPNVIKNFINKSKINYKSREGVQLALNKLTNTLTEFRIKTNKERQTYGLVDFGLSSGTGNNSITKTIPQQKIVQMNPIIPPNYETSRREFLNPKPLIIDAGMVPSISNNGNGNGNGNGKPQQQNIYLNQVETNNLYQNSYKSVPGNPNNQQFNLSDLKNLTLHNNEKVSHNNNNNNGGVEKNDNEVNHTDRYILMDKQKELLKEESGDWVYYLVIDSKDRDFTAYPDPNFYTIRFSPPNFSNSDARAGYVDKIFNNVKSIELIKCGFLDSSEETDSSDTGGADPPYVMLEVEEFGTQHNGANQFLNKSLAILDTYTKHGNYKYYDVVYANEGTINKFNPRITIDKMTIRFRLPNGQLYNFGANNKTKTSTVNYMVLKLTVMQRSLDTTFLNKTFG